MMLLFDMKTRKNNVIKTQEKNKASEANKTVLFNRKEK